MPEEVFFCSRVSSSERCPTTKLDGRLGAQWDAAGCSTLLAWFVFMLVKRRPVADTGISGNRKTHC
jgi:hypothetical protein